MSDAASLQDGVNLTTRRILRLRKMPRPIGAMRANTQSQLNASPIVRCETGRAALYTAVADRDLRRIATAAHASRGDWSAWIGVDEMTLAARNNCKGRRRTIGFTKKAPTKAV